MPRASTTARLMRRCRLSGSRVSEVVEAGPLRSDERKVHLPERVVVWAVHHVHEVDRSEALRCHVVTEVPEQQAIGSDSVVERLDDPGDCASEGLLCAREDLGFDTVRVE